ncbi:MAG: serine hydrolase domain-containing protein [Ekhidna sp.]
MDHLQKVLDHSIKNRYLFGVSLCVHQNSQDWCGVSGNLSLDRHYFIASTTKLFTSSLIFKLRALGKLDVEDPISKYLSEDVIKNLHRFKGEDHSKKITILHLLSHTSGLPDYFQTTKPFKKVLATHLKEGNDVHWDFNLAIEWSKEMSPLFEPSKPHKAYYSDTNFQLLGRIVENLYENKFADVLKREICDPLELENTYLYTDPTDSQPKKLFFKSNELTIPLAMTSFGADGGIVSTSSELMIFLKSFMNGKLFPKSYLKEIYQWNNIFFPLESGIGIHRFRIPWYFSPFRRIPEIIGHSGLSGAFAFYCPEMNTYLTGTVNQIYHPGNSFKLLMRILMELRKNS